MTCVINSGSRLSIKTEEELVFITIVIGFDAFSIKREEHIPVQIEYAGLQQTLKVCEIAFFF